MLYRARCSLVPRETRKKNQGNSLARDNLSSGSSSSRRADCCSSLSPISDCFFKAPVAEDINYPASVNHVICRPREGREETAGMEGEDDGTGGGGGGGGRGRRDEEGGDGRGMFEYDGESCCAMRGCCIAASRAKRSSAALHGRSNILLAVTEIYRRLARNFRLARWWIRLTARRGHPQLPCRSIDLSRILDRAHPDRGWCSIFRSVLHVCR